MSILAGLFLIAHGLVHLAVWVAPSSSEAPFDPRHSWLLGDLRAPSHVLAIAACALFILAGVLVVAGAALGSSLAVAGAVVSLALVLLTFNRWFVFAIAVNVAVVVVAVG